jgi:hypothetical protein
MSNVVVTNLLVEVHAQISYIAHANFGGACSLLIVFTETARYITY